MIPPALTGAEPRPGIGARARDLWEALRLRLRPARRPGGVVADAALIRPGEAGVDRILVGAVLMLACIGLVMVFSSGAVFAAKKYGDSFYFLKRESVFLTLGLGALWFAVRMDYSYYRRLAYPLLFVSLALLAAVLVVGSRAGGAIRWFRLGPLSFQPSELGKFALSIYLAMLLAKKAEQVKEFSVGFVPPLVVTGLYMGLLLKQPDLGTAAIFGAVALLLLFLAGTRTSYLIVALLIAAPVGWKFIVSTPFRMRRMLAFLDPWAFRRDVGYQITESLMSVGSGGLQGLGLGDGRQKLFFLPEAHTDFILSIVGEELGLMGIGAVILCFAVLTWRGLRAAFRARDVFGCYLAFAITSFFALQAMVNMGVVLGSLPTKGLPLPFISYGGTSLVASLFMAGVLANVSARNPEPKGITLFRPFGDRRGRNANRRRDLAPIIVVEKPGDASRSGPVLSRRKGDKISDEKPTIRRAGRAYAASTPAPEPVVVVEPREAEDTLRTEEAPRSEETP